MAAGLTAAAASLGLFCLGGLPKPAVAFPYGEYVPFWEFGIDPHVPKRHQSRKRSHGAKAAESAKPEPQKPPSGPLTLAISIGSQRVTVYDNGTPIAGSPISTGMAGHPTPTGVFSVIQKQRWHRSNLYSNAPMPYMQRITWSGVALHAGVLPGYPASHGCIRLPERFAIRLWGMTRVGARVVITRNDEAPYEINHPRLTGLVKAPEPVVEVRTRDVTPSSNANSDGSSITAGTVVAAPTTASTAAAALEKLHDSADRGTVAGASPSRPQVARVIGDSRSAVLLRAPEPPAREPTPTPVPNAKPPEASLRPGPVSLFVSRKEGKLFVRKGFSPVFETPITIARREVPFGTHVFTANVPTDGSAGLRWLAVSIGYDRAATNPTPAKRKTRARHDEPPIPASAEALHQAAADALDRIELPQEALDRVIPLMAAGASLVISDQGLGEETGRETDFIVVMK